MIGEKISPTGRKKLAEALANRDYEYVYNLAVQQAAAGADVLLLGRDDRGRRYLGSWRTQQAALPTQSGK